MKPITKGERTFFAVVSIVSVALGTGLFFFFLTPPLVPVITEPIRDDVALEKILQRINEENVKATVSPNGILMVKNENIARRIRVILITDDLIPENIDPWSVLGTQRWTITDFERNIRFRLVQEKLILDHINTLDDIDDVKIQIAWPDYRLINPLPVSVSVLITPVQGSDITVIPQNRRKIEGIIRLLQYAINNLQSEYIVITDNNGIVLNDF